MLLLWPLFLFLFTGRLVADSGRVGQFGASSPGIVWFQNKNGAVKELINGDVSLKVQIITKQPTWAYLSTKRPTKVYSIDKQPTRAYSG